MKIIIALKIIALIVPLLLTVAAVCAKYAIPALRVIYDLIHTKGMLQDQPQHQKVFFVNIIKGNTIVIRVQHLNTCRKANSMQSTNKKSEANVICLRCLKCQSKKKGCCGNAVAMATLSP